MSFFVFLCNVLTFVYSKDRLLSVSQMLAGKEKSKLPPISLQVEKAVCLTISRCVAPEVTPKRPLSNAVSGHSYLSIYIYIYVLKSFIRLQNGQVQPPFVRVVLTMRLAPRATPIS